MFRKVTGSMFELAQYYEQYWKAHRPRFSSRHYRECFSQKPIPVKINVSEMKKSFETEFESSKNTMRQFLPDSIVKDLELIVKKDNNFDSELWAEVVYNYAASWKNFHTEADKYLLLDTLKTLWIGRFVSFAKEVKEMDINEAEIVIQKQAEIFEEKFDYLRSVYEEQIMPT
jgi:hypothetical protein